MKRLLLALPMLLLVSAAAGAPLAAQTANPAEEARPRAVKKDRNLISEEEVRQSSAQNAFDLITNLRPQWLRMRGSNSLRSTRVQTTNNAGEQVSVEVPAAQEIVVYLDGVRYGNQGSLRDLPVTEVGTLQFLDGQTANLRLGMGHINGAILVTRRIRP